MPAIILQRKREGEIIKKIIILIGIVFLAVGAAILCFREPKWHTSYQAEPPVNHVSEADWVTLAEGEMWIPGQGEVITSERYYWKDWKRQLNGTESEALYYAHQESWDEFVKKSHAKELKQYEREHSGGDGIFHSHNDFFCVVEQKNAGLQPEVEGISQVVKENGKSKLTLYLSYSEGGVEDEIITYYYFVKIPKGLPIVEEIVICPDRLNRDETKATE